MISLVTFKLDIKWPYEIMNLQENRGEEKKKFYYFSS